MTAGTGTRRDIPVYEIIYSLHIFHSQKNHIFNSCAFLLSFPKYEGKVTKPEVSDKKPDSAKRKIDTNENVCFKNRRVGRPKNRPKIPEGIRSITQYFRTE